MSAIRDVMTLVDRARAARANLERALAKSLGKEEDVTALAGQACAAGSDLELALAKSLIAAKLAALTREDLYRGLRGEPVSPDEAAVGTLVPRFRLVRVRE